jgi:type IV pilus assembly protein PilY1
MLGNYVSSASEKYSRPETWTKISNTSYQYNSPTSLTQTNEVQKCSGQGLYMLTDGEPNGGMQTKRQREQHWVIIL